MYFCPHPQRYFKNGQERGPRRQLTLPKDRPQDLVQPQPQPVEQPQILRHPPQAANVIHLEAKGKEKVEEPKVMPVERTKTKKEQVSEEVTRPSASMETKEEHIK